MSVHLGLRCLLLAGAERVKWRLARCFSSFWGGGSPAAGWGVGICPGRGHPMVEHKRWGLRGHDLPSPPGRMEGKKK